MKILPLITLAAVVVLSGCKKNDIMPDQAVATRSKSTTAINEYPVKPADTLSGNLSAPVHLTSNKTWYLDGPVVISNTTITIDPGTVITGVTPGKTLSPDVLVIEQNAKITAKGTADQPIVFTSKYLIDGNPGTSPARGDFGGLVILGAAPVSGFGGQFWIQTDKPYPNDWIILNCGGNNTTHSSGELSFVRVEYAGVASFDNLFSGITFIGVGKGTKIDHIESAYSALYGFELNGGNFEATFLLEVGSRQDGISAGNNFTGSIDYGIILKAGGTLDESSGVLIVNGSPKFNHFTIVGDDKFVANTQFSAGIQMNNGAKLQLNNSIILGYTNGVYMWGSKYVNDFKNSISSAKNNIVTATNTVANYNNLNTYLDANGNKRYVWPSKANSFTRLRQPFIMLGNDVNLVPLSVSPANQGTTDQAGAFNDYSRPVSRWGHSKNWFRLYY